MRIFFDLQRFENIENSIPNKVISGTADNDSIKNTAAIVTIKSSSGNDNITNEGDFVEISCGVGDDVIANSGKNVTISAGNGNNSVSSSGTNVIISSGTGNDTVNTSYGNHVTVETGKGDDYISATENMHVSIFGGSGNDIINNSDAHFNIIAGGSGDDSISSLGIDVTISGGNGDDVITLNTKHNSSNFLQYESGDGNDAVIGFDSNDTLKIIGASISSMTSGNDIYFLIDGGSVRLEDVGNGVESSNFVVTRIPSLTTGLSYNSDKTALTASLKFKNSSINLTKYSTVKDLNASSVTRTLRITGNSFDNQIQGGSKRDTIRGGDGNDSIRGNAGNDKLYGEDGNDTLNGGAGNDTLTGGDGADVFIYTGGSDVIADYTAGEDIIQLGDSVTIQSWQVSGSNVIFTTTNGTVNVKKGKGQKIAITTTQTYSTSSSNVAELFAENNFATTEDLDAITENKINAVDYKISAQSFENLTQENSLVTFSEK